MPALCRPFLERRLDIGQCDTACFQQHQQMVKKIGRFGSEPVVVLLHGGQAGFDGLLAKLFGAMGYTLFDQGARIRLGCACLGALMNPFFKVGQRELAHARFFITSPRLRGEGGELRIHANRQARFGHISLGFAHRVLAKMKDRSGQYRGRMAVADAFDQVIQGADPA